MRTVLYHLRALAQVGRVLLCLWGAYQFLGRVPAAVAQDSAKKAKAGGLQQDSAQKTVAAASAYSSKPRSPDQLDALVAPIALYPDDLLAQSLVASTYPLEIVQL